MILVSEENMSSGGRNVKEHVLNYKTYFTEKSLGTTMFKFDTAKIKRNVFFVLKSLAV